jgi:hypothetical protein
VVMGPEGVRTKNECGGEDEQQITSVLSAPSSIVTAATEFKIVRYLVAASHLKRFETWTVCSLRSLLV